MIERRTDCAAQNKIELFGQPRRRAAVRRPAGRASETSGCVLSCNLSSPIKASSFITTTTTTTTTTTMTTRRLIDVSERAARRSPSGARRAGSELDQEQASRAMHQKRAPVASRESSFSSAGRGALSANKSAARSSSASSAEPHSTARCISPLTLFLVLVSVGLAAGQAASPPRRDQSAQLLFAPDAGSNTTIEQAAQPAANKTTTPSAAQKRTFEKQQPSKRSPTNSIFDSLLSGASGSAAPTGETDAEGHQQQHAASQQMSELNPYFKIGQVPDKVTLPGDILLGGLFPIHMKGTKVECGQINRDRGIQRLEAMLYALDRINEDSLLLPEIKLGAILLDSCSSSTYALNQSLEFIRASINTVESSAFECKDKSSPRPKYGSKMIAGVIGGSYSEVSLQVANLLRLFRIPQVSYASTGTALSDKTLYDLFARTVPSDMFQARAIADIVKHMGWSYVSLVSSEGLYGDSGSKEFMKQASNRRICIAVHEKISPTIGDGAYDLIVQSLFKRNATGVVLFTRAEDTRELLMAVKRAKLLHNFAWVAADGWGTHQKLVEGVEEVAWGAITVELQAKAIPGFDQYMRKLTPWGNGRNPWFSEYWQEWFDCQLQANLLQQQRLASGAAYLARRRSASAAPVEAEQQQRRRPSNIRNAWGSQTDDERDADSGRENTERARRSPAELAARATTTISGALNQQAATVNLSSPTLAQVTSCPSDGNNATKCSISGPPPSDAQNTSRDGSPPALRPVQVRRAKRMTSFGPSLVDEEAAHVKQFCSPNLRISESNGYRQEQKVQFVVDAVYAMAHALHKAWSHLCEAKPGVVCEALKELNGGEFYTKYLLNVSFKDLAGSEVKFDEHGDGLGRYNIYNFRKVLPQSATPNKDMVVPAIAALPNDSIATLESLGGGSPDAAPIDKFGGVPGSSYQHESTTGNGPEPVQVEHIYTSNVEFEYSTVGRWTEDDYLLSVKEIQFFQGAPEVPESYCSKPCEVGQAKIMRAGDHCCWICKTCQPYEFLPDEFSCQDCGIGRWPVANKTSCFDLPQKYLRWDSVFSLISLSVACLGIALTLFVTIIFVKYIDTPVVKASGRELSFILLAGVAFCHMATFVLLTKPTTFVCGSQRFLVNFGFALMYSSLLVKTNRISRIFNCARKSAKRPSFISPKSQMLITGILVAIQIFLTIVWYFFEPPGVRADSPEGKRDEVILKCRVKGRSFILSLVYNMILITTCTVYAVKTRKIPENFNESKFIGFTMYTTIVIWLAFVTMFFGTNNSYEIQMNTMCVCISLSAYVTLFCLFSPKISIILLHPDKNVRKLTMNSGTYKRAFKPVSSVASIDGRQNPPPGGSSQPEAASGGPMSTTSNVLNLDTQGNRLQESSVVSNVVNSNSGASNCSQKTPTTLSQQLALVGICANCGAHQLTSAPTTASTSTNAGGAFMTSTSGSASRQGNGTKNQIATSVRHTIADRGQGANGTHQQVQKGQCIVQSSNRAVGDGGTSKAAMIIQHKVPHAGGSQLGNEVTLRKQIKRSPSDELILSRRNFDGQNNHSSSVLGGRPSHQQQQPHQQQQNVCSTGLSSGAYSGDQRQRHAQANGRPHISSLNRLNEMTSFTSSGDRQCIEESISSLANDSFMNTSLENTPCNMAHAGAHYQSGRAANQCKGSDSMLCNQSVHSMDYCSDCCPSICQCSCQVCLSQIGTCESGGASLCSHRHNSTSLIRAVTDDDYGFDGVDQGNYDAMCIVQLVQRNGGEQQDESALLMNDEATGNLGSHFDTSDTSGSTLIRCRKLSIESGDTPARQPGNSSGKVGGKAPANVVTSKPITSKSGLEKVASARLPSSTHRQSDPQYILKPVVGVAAEWSSQSSRDVIPKPARRSQTMEMRTIHGGNNDGSTKNQQRYSRHADYRASSHAHSSHYDSGDSVNSNSQLADLRSGRGKKQSGQKHSSKTTTSSPFLSSVDCSQSVAYALQSAATSALGAAATQMISASSSAGDNTRNQPPEATSSTSGTVTGGGIQSKYDAANRGNLARITFKGSPSSAFLESNLDKQTGEVDDVVAIRSQKQLSANQTLGTIQASLERVKSLEARRKSLEVSAAERHRRKSGCFNYHDDYEYSYGLVQSSDDESGGIEDYYFDDDEDDDDYDEDDNVDEGRECYYDKETYMRLDHGLALTRKSGTSKNVAGDSAPGQAAKMSGAAPSATTCDHARTANEPLTARGAGRDDDKSASLGNDDDDDDFEHDGRVSLERAGLGRASQQKQGQASRIITSEESRFRAKSGDDEIIGPGRRRKHHQRRSSTKRRSPRKRQLEQEEHRINSAALITATLSAGGAIVESCGGFIDDGTPANQPTSSHQLRHHYQSGDTAREIGSSAPTAARESGNIATGAPIGKAVAGNDGRDSSREPMNRSTRESSPKAAGEQKPDRDLVDASSSVAKSQQRCSGGGDADGAGGSTSTYLGSF